MVSIPRHETGWQLMIHGGAGKINRSSLSAEQDRGARAGLESALSAGEAVLKDGGSALDAVESAVRVLEDDPHFNAGRGAVLTATGGIELDAAIMNGRTRHAGAVAGVSETRNPVSLARIVMDRTPHVFLAGVGGDAFSRGAGLEQKGFDWFATDERRRQLAELQSTSGSGFDAEMKYGTVGAVARDVHGSLAAATSTGGVMGKQAGRIGDSPVIGAGTYADDRSCAISCTGSGETFLRIGVAQEIAARVRLLNETIETASEAVMTEVVADGGTGGVIVIGARGEPLWRFTTSGMFRASTVEGGSRMISIYGDES